MINTYGISKHGAQLVQTTELSGSFGRSILRTTPLLWHVPCDPGLSLSRSSRRGDPVVERSTHLSCQAADGPRMESYIPGWEPKMFKIWDWNLLNFDIAHSCSIFFLDVETGIHMGYPLCRAIANITRMSAIRIQYISWNVMNVPMFVLEMTSSWIQS